VTLTVNYKISTLSQYYILPMETSRRKVHRRNGKALLVAVYHLIWLVFEIYLKTVTSELYTSFSMKALTVRVFCSLISVYYIPTYAQISSVNLPYILESNPHPFYSFRRLKNQMRITIACGLDLRSRAGFWKNDRAAERAVRTIQYNTIIYYFKYYLLL
jgi:hypothetical protein